MCQSHIVLWTIKKKNYIGAGNVNIASIYLCWTSDLVIRLGHYKILPTIDCDTDTFNVISSSARVNLLIRLK